MHILSMVTTQMVVCCVAVTCHLEEVDLERSTSVSARPSPSCTDLLLLLVWGARFRVLLSVPSSRDTGEGLL